MIFLSNRETKQKASGKSNVNSMQIALLSELELVLYFVMSFMMRNL